MTRHDVALLLDTCEYRKEISPDFRKQLSEAGIVVAYGASDDLVELDGAIVNEYSADYRILFNNKTVLENECSDDNCPYYARLKATIKKSIIGHYGIEGWHFEVENIPIEKFTVLEDGNFTELELYFT